MLVLLNQFDMIHEDNIYENVNETLRFEKNFYILDTDDMVVESISYKDLYSYIKDEIISVANVIYDDEVDDLYCCEENYTFMDYVYDGFQTTDGYVKFKINERNRINGIVTINNKSYELKVGLCKEDIDGFYNNVLLNNKVICSIRTEDGLYFRRDFFEDKDCADDYLDGFYGVPYIASLGDKYLIHFYITSGGVGFELLLVIDRNGDIYDIFPLSGFEDYFYNFKFKPKSMVFRTKYKTIFKEKY